MKQDSYYLAAYWGNRQESIEECSQRILLFLQSLAHVDEAFAHWFGLGRSRKEALSSEIMMNGDAIRGLLDRGRHRRDTDDRLVEDLGFTVGLWNGGLDCEAAALSAHCGSYASTAVTWLPNTCVLNLPRQGTVANRLLRVDELVELLGSTAKAFEPDWARVTSRQYSNLYPPPSHGMPAVGWITYLSIKYGRIPPLPPPARRVGMDGLGSIVVATEERFITSNPQHVRAADEIAKRLRETGILRRIY